MSITKTIQAIGKDIGTINKAITSIDGKIKQVSDELSSQYVTQSAFDALTAQINALTKRVEKLEQGTSAQAEPSPAQPPKPSEPPKQTEQPKTPTLKAYRSRKDGDSAEFIKELTAWYDTLPKDNGKATVADGYGGGVSYSQSGKLYYYIDGFRGVKQLSTAGRVQEFDGFLHQLEDDEGFNDIDPNHKTSNYGEKVHITVVRQADDGQIYAVYNALSNTYRSDVFDPL